MTGGHTTDKQAALDAAHTVMIRIATDLASRNPTDLARQAWRPGGPTVTELETRIRALLTPAQAA